MKKVLSLVLAVALAASLSACGGVLVDLDTPKSEELTAQYDFYPDAMNIIRADMKITPEQADEVFILTVRLKPSIPGVICCTPNITSTMS